MAVLDNIFEGTFKTAATPVVTYLNLPGGFDHIEVFNYSQWNAASSSFKFEWFKGMPSGSALVTSQNAVPEVYTSTIPTGGFTLISPTGVPIPGGQLSGTAISAATPPVVSSAATSTLKAGDIVVMYNCTGATEFNGYYFTVGPVTANSAFTLSYAPTIVAGTTCNYRIMSSDAQFYPRNRLIASISKATQAVVTFTVTHGLTVGQEIVFNVPAAFGMTQMNGLRGTILAINTTTNAVTVNIDSSGFSTFAFPLTGAAPFTPAQAVPFGDGLDITNPLQTSATLAGATQNTSFNGVALGLGVTGTSNVQSNGMGPAGTANDVMYWRATKSGAYYPTSYTPL
jgi:hypothetical protein